MSENLAAWRTLDNFQWRVDDDGEHTTSWVANASKRMGGRRAEKGERGRRRRLRRRAAELARMDSS